MRDLLIFRNPAFGRFWAARLLSTFGTYVTVAALTLYVARGFGAAQVGLLVVSGSLPRLLGPLAGAVVDRMDARRLMVFCDLGQAALVGVIAFLLPPLPVLLGLVAAASVLSTLFFPAGRSAIPALVDDGDLAPANALLGSAFNLSIAMGPLLGAFAFAAVGVRGALAFDAVTFVLSAALALTLRAMPATVGETASGLLAETRDGLVYVARNPAARAVVVSLLLGVAFVSVDLVALVFLARDALGAGDIGFGVISAAHGVGMILGPLLLLRSRRSVPLGLVFVGLAVDGAATALTGLAPFFVLAVALKAASGLGNGLENVAADTTLQKVVERPMLGRVFGAFYGGVMLAEALGSALGALLVEATSARAAFVIAGGATLAVAILAWRRVARLRV